MALLWCFVVVANETMDCNNGNGSSQDPRPTVANAWPPSYNLLVSYSDSCCGFENRRIWRGSRAQLWSSSLPLLSYFIIVPCGSLATDIIQQVAKPTIFLPLRKNGSSLVEWCANAHFDDSLMLQITLAWVELLFVWSRRWIQRLDYKYWLIMI